MEAQGQSHRWRSGAFVVAIVTTLVAAGVWASFSVAAGCPNEGIRLRQGTTYLPQCMALEMVSPATKENRPAYSPEISVDGNRVLFWSYAALGDTPGLVHPLKEQYVATRGTTWDTAATSPPAAYHFGIGQETGNGLPLALSPDLGSWLSVQATPSQAARGVMTVFEGTLEEGFAPRSPLMVPSDGRFHGFQSYVEAATGVTRNFQAVSDDLSKLLFRAGDSDQTYLAGDPQPDSTNGGPGRDEASLNTYLIQNDTLGQSSVSLVARDSTGTAWGGTCGARVGGGEAGVAGTRNQGALSSDGGKAYFTTRPNQVQPLSWDLRKPSCVTVGTVSTNGSSTLSNVVSARGAGVLTAGQALVTDVTIGSGAFLVGQEIGGSGIAPGTTIAAVGPGTIELSANATASGAQTFTAGVQPFAVGQAIAGAGIPSGATITAVSGQTLTISAPATTTASGVSVSAIDPLRILERRETPTGVEISELIPGGSAAGSDLFEGASEDGSRVYFTTTRQLAGSDVDGGSRCNKSATIVSQQGCDLYLYEKLPGGGHELIQVSAGEATAGHPTPGSGAEVFMGVVAISGDGSRVYYVARGALTEQPNPEGTVAVAGDLNLYLYERDATHPDGHTAFVGALDSACTPVANEGVAQTPDCGNLLGTSASFKGGAVALPMLGRSTDGTEVGGDGHILAFQSTSPLTADDQDGKRLDVFRYDALAGQLACVSCAPGGDVAPFSVFPRSVSTSDGAMSGPDFAQRNRWASEDGQSIVFATAEPLVAGDVDGRVNSYLWRQGQLTRLPGPGGGVGQRLVPTLSADGNELAFETTLPLLPVDGDSAEDVYVARVGGGFPEPAALPACVGDACQGPPAPAPAPLAAASSSFAGKGNAKRAPRKAGQSGKRKQQKKAGQSGKRKQQKNKSRGSRRASSNSGAAR